MTHISLRKTNDYQYLIQKETKMFMHMKVNKSFCAARKQKNPGMKANIKPHVHRKHTQERSKHTLEEVLSQSNLSVDGIKQNK